MTRCYTETGRLENYTCERHGYICLALCWCRANGKRRFRTSAVRQERSDSMHSWRSTGSTGRRGHNYQSLVNQQICIKMTALHRTISARWNRRYESCEILHRVTHCVVGLYFIFSVLNFEVFAGDTYHFVGEWKRSSCVCMYANNMRII